MVWRLARASSHLPSSTSVITTADDSKYRCAGVPPRAPAAAPRSGRTRRWCRSPPAGPCCRCRRAAPSSRRGRSARRARTAPAWPAANCSQPGSIQCTPNSAASIGRISGADSSAAIATRQPSREGFGGAGAGRVGIAPGVAGLVNGLQQRRQRRRCRARVRCWPVRWRGSPGPPARPARRRAHVRPGRRRWRRSCRRCAVPPAHG